MFGPAVDGEVWTGDDAAVIATSARTLVTVDSMSEHVDFELDWARGDDIGYKLVAINVSDIAAMGGRPTRAVATVQLGEETDVALVERIAAGMSEAAASWQIGVVGGDLGRGVDISLTMTLLGEPTGPPVLRSGAREGDAVCVTGTLGGAHAGLLVLQLGAVEADAVRAEITSGSGADGLAVLAAAQLRPRPRLSEGQALTPLATAMIDVSDGLAIDLERICRASGVGCDIWSAAVPFHPDLHHAANAVPDLPEPLGCALLGGEDLELLFTVPEDRLGNVESLLDDIGTSISVLGRITEGGMTIDEEPLDEWSEQAWDHLRIR